MSKYMEDPRVVAFSNELHEWNGSTWRVSAPADDVLYVEVDGYPFYLKVKCNDPKTTHVVVQKTQIKCEHDAGWIVAFLMSGFYDYKGRPYERPNHYIVQHLEQFLEVRPFTPKNDPRLITVKAWR